MRFGIDFGTTRTVVARVDRGNYPVMTFTDTDGEWHEYFPTVAALRGDEIVYGFEAEAAGRDGASLVRSFKRILGEPTTTPTTHIDIGGRSVLLLDVVTGFLAALRAAMVAESDDVIPPDGDGPHAVVSVPAHAHTAQRYLTLDAYRRAGFTVLALVNEPSAAGFEYTHRQPRTLSSRRTQVLVYDLGGGTFDASLIQAQDGAHDVIASAGLNRLGGDDFDGALAEIALAQAEGAAGGKISVRRSQWRRLVDDAREAKERLTPQTRKIVLDVADQTVIVAVDDYYQAVAPLIEATIDAMEPLVGSLDSASVGESLSEVAGIYLVGGGSALPVVARTLRERFGRRVHRSPYPAAATAIGLAIAADPDSGYTLTDRLSRGFGVFRERAGGEELGFDEIFSAAATVPDDGLVTVTRRYRAVHNIGWFRYVEYTEQDGEGEPRGELVPFAQVLFPFDPALRDAAETTGGQSTADGDDLSSIPVTRMEHHPLIEETYSIDATGMVSVVLEDVDTGYRRRYGLR